MKVEIKITKQIELTELRVKASVRYWEDAEVNGTEDTEGNIPCREGDNWCPVIDIDSGKIKNWTIGVTAKIHYKVCDCCAWELYDDNGTFVVGENDGYVPNTLCPAGSGYGDYIKMYVDENGQIEGWKFEIDDFLGGEE